MFRRNLIVLAGAVLAASLAACYSSTPTTSVGTLRYSSASTTAAHPVGEPSVPQPAAPTSTPGSTNDPLYRLDMP